MGRIWAFLSIFDFMARTTPLRVSSFPLSRVRLLDGIFKERQAVHAGYLMSVDSDRLLAPFRIQAGLQPKAERYGGWESRDISGHTLGHYLSALCHLFACRGGDEVLHSIDYIVEEIEACQAANGDGYALPLDKAAFEKLRGGHIDASPFALNGVWVPFYTMHKVLAGLRDAHRLAARSRALEAERRMADWLDGVLGGLNAEQIQLVLRAEHGGMNEVLADLSVDTGDPRYLRMAERCFHHAVTLDPMLRGEDRLDGLHGNTQIPKVIGLAREYELTGNPGYRLAAESFWDTVVNRRSYAIGGHGESEHFFPSEQFPQRLTTNTCETCNTYNMLKLTSYLFAWDERADRMDFVERAMINHLAANIGRGPGEFGYFLGLGSVGVKVFSTPYDSWWCCVGTGLENPVRYGEQIYSHDSTSLWVNLYFASTLSWPERGIEVRQETSFPDGDTVRLVFDCQTSTALTLRLRHPYWCDAPAVSVNGEPVAIRSHPASYLAIERIWQSGDTVEIKLPMALRLEPLPHSEDKVLAVMYGPTVLAAIVPEEPGISNPAGMRFSEHLDARGKTDAFPPLFVAADASSVLAGLRPTGRTFAEFRSQGAVKPNDLTFVPFHRIYEEQYAVYFPLLTPGEWQSREGEIRAERDALRKFEAATLDVITPGYQQPEVEHALRGEGSEIEDFANRKCRLARDGGWFSYEMAIDAESEVTLVVTYWGGVWHKRVFELWVDDRQIDSQVLFINKPGDFFDEVYPIPAELTRGKQKVTVRFQSRPGDIAGGIFGLRIMRAEAAPKKGFDTLGIAFKDH